ncbi:MAG: metallophosphoesterase family protein [Chloroflexota bacterium]
MKLAIISDIHGNVPALHAITNHLEAWQPDRVIVNGDVVNRGPNSVPCWEFVAQKRRDSGWFVTKGNHEDFVLSYRTRPPNNHSHGIHRHASWTFAQLTDYLDALDALPDTISLTDPDGSEVRITHASMLGNRKGIYIDTPEERVQELIAPAPPLFCTSHVHWPLLRQVGGTCIARSGSVGSPRDGDWRGSYLQISWQQTKWHVEVLRIPYDRDATDRDYHQIGYLAEGGPVAQLIYHEWKTALPVLAPWQRQYQEAVLAGEIGLETAVNRYLQANGLLP